MSPEDIRTSYIAPEPSHQAQMTELAHVAGIEITESGVSWENQEQDYERLDQMADLIIATVQYSDTDFNQLVIPQLRAQAEQTTIFSKLKSQNDVSAAHSTNPFEHTFDVVGNVNTEGLPDDQKFWLRFDALIHDLGKSAIAKDDFYSWHARISGRILQDYMLSRKAHPQEVELRQKVIDGHHLLNLVDNQVITPEEFLHFYANDIESLVLLGALSFADAKSAEGNQRFAVKNAEILLQIFKEFDLLLKLPKEYLEKFVCGMIALLRELSERVTKAVKEVSERAKNYIEELIKEIPQFVEGIIKQAGLEVDQDLLPVRLTQ